MSYSKGRPAPIGRYLSFLKHSPLALLLAEESAMYPQFSGLDLEGPKFDILV